VGKLPLANEVDVQFYVQFWKNLSLMKGAQEEANLRQRVLLGSWALALGN
jgi:hypothetical protein